MALITFDGTATTAFDGLNLETVELREGELFVSGTNGRNSPARARPSRAESGLRPPDARGGPTRLSRVVGSAEKETRQK